jgi:hypothetical protein
MLIKFQTKAYASITMFGEVALTLIKLMGHSGSVPSAVLADDIPAALARLQSAVAAQPEHPLDPVTASNSEAGQHVSLAHRALPLIALLQAAAAEGEAVLWEQV